MPQPWLLLLLLLALSPSAALRRVDDFIPGILSKADFSKGFFRSGAEAYHAVTTQNISAVSYEAFEKASGMPNKIAYLHMTKTGGSFTERVLTDVAGLDNLLLGFEDFHSLQGKIDYLRMLVLHIAKLKPFTIGSIRRPCDWYVSLWADLGKQLRRDGISLDGLYSAEPMRNMTDDVARFRKFVRHVYEPAAEGQYHDPENWTGMMTSQFAWRYSRSFEVGEYFLLQAKARLERDGDPYEYDGYTRPVNNKASRKLREKAMKSLWDFNKSKVDCWLETSSLERDLRTCLEKAEKKTKVKMNWTQFEHALVSRGHNPSQHGACRQYFDQDTENLIRKVDKFIFEKFNYSSCCSPE